MRLLMMMMQGKVITFDDRTHRKLMRATRRLTYVFLAAHQMEGQLVEAVQADVLQHLEAAQDKLCKVWGQTELDRLYNGGHTLANLTLDWQEKISSQIGEDTFAGIKATPLDQLNSAEQDSVIDILGKAAQNRLYRHLLLSKISELWVEYLTKVEALRVSVRMEAYGQRDPLVEYRGQASEMFSNLLSEIRAGVIDQMFRIRLVSKEEADRARSSAQGTSPAQAAPQQKPQKKKSRRRH
jgi:preprotein translocase subunit SecA